MKEWHCMRLAPQVEIQSEVGPHLHLAPIDSWLMVKGSELFFVKFKIIKVSLQEGCTLFKLYCDLKDRKSSSTSIEQYLDITDQTASQYFENMPCTFPIRNETDILVIKMVFT
jgi:hypothetical protein